MYVIKSIYLKVILIQNVLHFDSTDIQVVASRECSLESMSQNYIVIVKFHAYHVHLVLIVIIKEKRNIIM